MSLVIVDISREISGGTQISPRGAESHLTTGLIPTSLNKQKVFCSIFTFKSDICSRLNTQNKQYFLLMLGVFFLRPISRNFPFF